MSKTGKIGIAVVGLGFGLDFARIYREHPDVGFVGVCDVSEQRLNSVAGSGFDRLHVDFKEVLATPEYDAVHI
jgi:predicted dehydrogenase